MRIFFTSDLHLHPQTRDPVLRFLKRRIDGERPDVLVVSGDVTDMPDDNVFTTLGTLGVPAVFCLGNHEFAYGSVDQTLARMAMDCSRAAEKGVKDVHCLDVEGHVDMGGVRFYGNVLWYDGSLSNRKDTAKYMRHVWENWLDSSIRDFDPAAENAKCVEAIREADASAPEGCRKVLVTHCVPHRRLNRFDVLTPSSIANCYSGMDDLFDSAGVYPDLALCGHTHQRIMYEHAGGGRTVRCVNSGNDYFWNSNTVIFDMLEV